MANTRYALLIGLFLAFGVMVIPARADGLYQWADDPMPWPPDMVSEIRMTITKSGYWLDKNNYYAIGSLSQSVDDPYIWYATILILSPGADPHHWQFEQDVVDDFQMVLDYANLDGRIAEFVNPPADTLGEQITRALLVRDTDIDIGVDKPIFPWMKDTYAYYGALGIHSYGTNYPGWFAIDFVSGPFMGETGAPNAVFAATDGKVTVLCTDATQTGIKIGQFQYLHLNTGAVNIYDGKSVRQGEYLGSLILGTHDTNCGYTDQSDENYHLHFGFKGEEVIIENYVLGYGVLVDQRTSEVIEPEENILAEWTSELIAPPIPPGVPPDYNIGIYRNDSFWDFLVGGFQNMSFQISASLFPQAADMLPKEFILRVTGITLALIYMVSLVNFWFVTLVFTLIGIMEIARFTLGTYKFIKSLIPLV